MASAIFQHILEQSGLASGWRVESAGTWASDGFPASIGSLLVMNHWGLDIIEHRSRIVTREILSSFDLVLTMEKGHQEALRVEFQEFAENIHLLSEMAGYLHDIRDPIGGTISDYEAIAQELTSLLSQGFEKIKSLASRGKE